MLYSTDFKTLSAAIEAGKPVTVSPLSAIAEKIEALGVSLKPEPSDTIIATLTLGDNTLRVDLAALDYKFDADILIDLFPPCYDEDGDQLDVDSVDATFEFLGNAKLIKSEFNKLNTLEDITLLDSYIFEFCNETLDNYDAVVIVMEDYTAASLSEAIDIVSDAVILDNTNEIKSYINDLAQELLDVDTSNSYITFDTDGFKRDYLMDVTWYGCDDNGPLIITH